jgi:hypothetical protein
MVARWDLDRLLGYLGTWSAVVRHRDRCGSDPLDQIRANLKRPGATLTLNSM